MTNEEFQQQIEQMLAIQRQLQESDLRRAEQFEQTQQQFEQTQQQFEQIRQQIRQQFEQTQQQFDLARQRQDRTDAQLELLTQRQNNTDEQIKQLISLMQLQGQRFALMTEAIGLQDGQIKDIYGRLDHL